MFYLVFYEDNSEGETHVNKVDIILRYYNQKKNELKSPTKRITNNKICEVEKPRKGREKSRKMQFLLQAK